MMKKKAMVAEKWMWRVLIGLRVVMSAVALAGCMHVQVKAHDRDTPVRVSTEHSVRPQTRFWVDWASTEDTPAIQMWTEDVCVRQDTQVVSRTVEIERTVEDIDLQLISTGIPAGVFGLAAGGIALVPKQEDNPGTRNVDESSDLSGVAAGMGWTAVGIVAISLVWALSVAARSGDYENLVGEVGLPLAPVEAICNERGAGQVAATVIYRGDSDLVVGEGTTDETGRLNLNETALSFAIIEDESDTVPHLRVQVATHANDYIVGVPPPVVEALKLQRQQYRAAVAADLEKVEREEAARAKAAERRYQRQRQAALARGECGFDGYSSAECELRLCARIAGSVRTMQPDTSCNAGEPLDSFRSDWGRALRAIDSYLRVVRSRGDMRNFLRVQQQVKRCRTPEWFRSCSN